MEPPNYTPKEEDGIVDALRAGRPPSCPRCEAPMEQRDVPPREGVAYVRHRLWLTCAGCRRSFVVDRRRLD